MLIPAIKIQNLSKTYSNGVRAIESISLEIEKGEFFALLGANGAGKTTTIGILTGLVNKSGGKVEIFGIDIDKDFNKAKTFIGVVPQEFNFNMFEKCIDIVVNQAGYYGIPRKVAIPRAEQILTDLGLGDKINDISRTLSGGMKRRLMIARSLIHEPEILILDEPTAGVDIELRLGMWKYLEKLKSTRNITVLLTTHYLEEVEALCDKCAIINKGKIARLDTVKNLTSSLSEQNYLIETKNQINQKEISKLLFQTKIINDTTFEITVTDKTTINQLIHSIDKINYEAISIKPSSNRLEKLFIQTIHQ